MKTFWAILSIPMSAALLIGALLLGASIGGSGCIPPATCGGTELGLWDSAMTLLFTPYVALFGIWLIFTMWTMSGVMGVLLTLFLVLGLSGWLVWSAGTIYVELMDETDAE